MRSRQMILNDMPRKSSLQARPSVDELKMEVLLDIRELLLNASLVAENMNKKIAEVNTEPFDSLCKEFYELQRKIKQPTPIEKKCKKCGKEFIPGSIAFPLKENDGFLCFECKECTGFEKANFEDDHQNG